MGGGAAGHAGGMSVLSRVAARLPQLPVPVVTWAARRFMHRSFGEPALDPNGPRGDTGLLGPGSASWRLYADAAAIPGGVRSLLVQLTHPLAMVGVAEHSRYLTDPLGRLQQTSAYVATVTFGSVAEALDVTSRVRAIHRSVRGTAPDGRPYDAADPELVTWVSVAGTASWLATDRQLGTGPLDAAERDAFVAEQALVAGLLDPRVDLAALRAHPRPAEALRRGEVSLPLVTEGWLPTTEAALQERMAWFGPRLAVGTHGRDALRFLLNPPLDPLLRVGYLPILAGAVGTLDPLTRRLLGLPVGEAAARALRVQGELGLIGLRTALARPSPNAERARQRLAA